MLYVADSILSSIHFADLDYWFVDTTHFVNFCIRKYEPLSTCQHYLRANESNTCVRDSSH